MKKLYKKIAIILVSIIITNALLSNIVLAEPKLTQEQLNDPILSQTQTDHSQIQTPEDVDKYKETGEAEGSSDAEREVITAKKDSVIQQISAKHDRDTNLQSDQSAFTGTTLASLIKLIPGILQIIMSQAVNVSIGSEDKFTIQNLLMGKYELFDINIFNKNVEAATSSDISKKIKESVQQWYGTIRTIAIMASLVVLLYTAIRMALSTTADDRARYNKMLTSWFVGFALIFILHYIAMALIYTSDALVKTLASLVPTTQKPFENEVFERIMLAEAKGWSTVIQAILYFMLVWYQSKFFFIYLKRVISNAFLILIAPLVTITYAIDKSNDCKAQAFNAWLEEMITNIFIQPMHLVLFLVLLYSAGAIAASYPIVAILFMFGLGKAESLLRGLFKLRGSTIENIEDGTSFAGLVKKI